MRDRIKKKVAIAIQARLASTRFPRKSVMQLTETGLTPITSLIQNCRCCADHVSSKRDPNLEVSVDVRVLVPDVEVDFWNDFLGHKHVNVLGGSMTNVLSRYTDLLKHDYDFIMRLTSDCPNVPNLAMNKAIWTALYHDMDYCSNVWESYRTCPDGHDIEVMSKKAMEWLGAASDLDKYKEHVTLAIRELMPRTLKKGCLVTKEDLSHIKLCIDTEVEYKQACERFVSAYHKRKQASKMGLYVYEY
jgi:spore coat polysaccharide biosynthesis protein SpsF (cytidylyltransferase family)